MIRCEDISQMSQVSVPPACEQSWCLEGKSEADVESRAEKRQESEQRGAGGRKERGREERGRQTKWERG